MAKRDDDLQARYDKDKTGGGILRIVQVCQHEEFSGSEWAGARSAAASGLSSLDSWYANCGDSARAAWWAGKPSSYREDMRQAMLGLA
jgi:hypothetical protein